MKRGGSITLPDEPFSEKLLTDRYQSINPVQREKILTWQSSDPNTGLILSTNVENTLGSSDYGKKLKGFGDICNSIFENIKNAVNKGNREELKKLAPTLLYYDEQCICLLPANAKNTTVLTANPTSFTLGGQSGASSHMHVLVIPIQRLYNAVSLTPKHIDLLKHMENIGRKVVCQLAVADNYYKTDEIATQPPLLTIPDSETIMKSIIEKDLFEYSGYLPYGFNLYKDAAKGLLGEKGEDVKAFFQVHPDNSIGYLHMHMVPMKLVSKAGGETYFKENRNIPVEHVIAHLEKLKLTSPKDGGYTVKNKRSFTSRTLKDLQLLAKSRGIPYSGVNKDELIKKLKNIK